MDVAELIKVRLEQLDYEQRDLAKAIQVTPSFVSQLLKRKKRPPSPHRTNLYKKMEKFLKLPVGDLSKLADMQRNNELKSRWENPPKPIWGEVRELVLRKCHPDKQNSLRQIFIKEPFGEIERMVTQKLLDVAQNIAQTGGKNENWLRLIARHNGKSYEAMRKITRQFLAARIFSQAISYGTYFLEPLIESWDIDLLTFNMSVVLSPTLGRERIKRFAFVEMEPDPEIENESGLRDFLRDRAWCADITDEEVAFLRKLKFKERRPNALYYYREWQNLRDPLHFCIQSFCS